MKTHARRGVLFMRNISRSANQQRIIILGLGPRRPSITLSGPKWNNCVGFSRLSPGSTFRAIELGLTPRVWAKNSARPQARPAQKRRASITQTQMLTNEQSNNNNQHKPNPGNGHIPDRESKQDRWRVEGVKPWQIVAKSGNRRGKGSRARADR